MAHYEAGIKAPELAKLPAIAKALGVTVAELFADEAVSHQAATARVSPESQIGEAAEGVREVEACRAAASVEAGGGIGWAEIESPRETHTVSARSFSGFYLRGKIHRR